ncbi:MAG TPA: hypothetical protein VFL36_01430 [Myxococcales bacterium]|nr:hypothetical protein [Myxococcales bacterium]
MKRLAPRLVFLVLLGGVLILWGELRKPRDLVLQIDLSGAMPGEIEEVDVIVRRGGHALARHDVRYGDAGAPDLLEFVVHAAPGEVEVETTLASLGKPDRRVVSEVNLVKDAPARVWVR